MFEPAPARPISFRALPMLAAAMLALAPGGPAPIAASPAEAKARAAKPAKMSRAATARALFEIARGPHLADPAAVERILALPGLAAGLEWKAPPSWDKMSGDTGTFWVKGGNARIRNLVFQRGVMMDLGTGYAPYAWLNVIFNDGACLEPADIEAAFGTKIREMMIPEPHGRGSYPHHYFDLEAANGAKVSLSVEECVLRMDMAEANTAVSPAG